MRRTLASVPAAAMCAAAWLVVAAAGGAARADGPARAPQPARVSAIEGGSLLVKRAGATEPVEAVVNAPVFPGDFLSSGAATRAEIQLDGFTMLRLSQDVQAHIAGSDAALHRLQLAAGTVELSVLHAEGASTSIETPSVTIRASKPGDVRVTVGADGRTTATARAGSAVLETPQQSYAMQAGTTYVASGSAAHPSVTTTQELAYDAFDDFNVDRDETLLAALDGNANVPPPLAGYDDLNKYGQWIDVEPYGQVWSPSGVGGDWVPYRNGQWTWTAEYGWTWIASEPWGWVPYHYGRWLYDDANGWCWDPPAALADASQWEPALVGFFGWGDQSSSSVSYASIGWAPLAPGETFNPWYGPQNPPRTGPPPVRPSPRPRNTGDPVRPPVTTRPSAATYQNAEFGGATGVDAQSFHDGDFSGVREVDMTQLDNVRLVRAALPIVPSAANERFTTVAVKSPPLRAFGPGHAAYPLSSHEAYARAIAPLHLAAPANATLRAQPSVPAHAPAARAPSAHAPPAHAPPPHAPEPHDSGGRPPAR